MKPYFVAILFFISVNLFAQSVPDKIKEIRVEVVDWGSLSIWIGVDFFDATKTVIMEQIGEEEFQWMKDHCTSRSWPKGLYQSSLDKEEDKVYEEKLNRLKNNQQTHQMCV